MNISKLYKNLKRRLSVKIPNEDEYDQKDDQSSPSMTTRDTLTFSSQLQEQQINNHNNNENNPLNLSPSPSQSQSPPSSDQSSASHQPQQHEIQPPSLQPHRAENEEQESQNEQDAEDDEEEEEEILPLDSDQSEDDDDDDDPDDEASINGPDENQEDENEPESKQAPRGPSISIEEKESSPARFKNKNITHSSSSSQLSINTETIHVETITQPRIYNISWRIDEQSLKFADLKNKNKSRNDNYNNNSDGCEGVLFAEIIKNGITFKLELCISGWKNSSRGYSAFYLTIPRVKNGGIGNKKDNKELVARYCVSIKALSNKKISSIRDDFHLGVGFPNFCVTSSLTQSQEQNPYKELQLDLSIEIFKTQNRIKPIEQVIYTQYVHTFGIDISDQKDDEENKENDGKLKNIKNKIISKYDQSHKEILSKMYVDRMCTDIEIKCKTKDNELKSIHVHKCVLIHSSIIFENMFDKKRNGFIESLKNEINLENSLWDFVTIENMIKFLYFGKITDISLCDGENIENLFKLFQIAEYFGIESLINECCNQFILTLSPNNACFLLIKLSQFKHVKQIEFIYNHNILWRCIIKNIKKVQKAYYYKEILYKHPIILNELIQKLAS